MTSLLNIFVTRSKIRRSEKMKYGHTGGIAGHQNKDDAKSSIEGKRKCTSGTYWASSEDVMVR